ncbi:MAG: quinolinate synthase NadA [Nanoarchaeota archaeon]|nr:quinolinate synthase NadA [Nanoarchaeota archaeon]
MGEQLESQMSDEKLIELILELKKQRNAIILAHNYQDPSMFKIADFVGDSLGLSRKAMETSADVILFCGVKFMAETAKILNPAKKVLLPSFAAGCSLADMATVEQLAEVKAKHPHAAVVSYVNTNADIKAMSDMCCTSSNAVDVVNAVGGQEEIFLPDKNLGRYVQSKTDKKIILWDGHCFVHDKLDAETLRRVKLEHPGAKVIAHPEAKSEILAEADHVCGTGGMASFANSNGNSDFIVVTECGMTSRLQEELPEKNFYSFCNVCPFMKSNSLRLVARSLMLMQHEIELDAQVMVKARRALDRMMGIKVSLEK